MDVPETGIEKASEKASSLSNIDEIKKLHELKELGIVTEQEFRIKEKTVTRIINHIFFLNLFLKNNGV